MGSEENKLGPNERPAWGEALSTMYGGKSLITPRGRGGLEKALSLYAPYTTEELENNEGLLAKIANEALPEIDKAVDGIILQIQVRYFDKGVLSKGVIETVQEVERAILKKYPEYGIPGLIYSEGLVLNRITERVQAYLVNYVALKEDAHRNYRLNPKKQKKRIKGLKKIGREIMKDQNSGAPTETSPAEKEPDPWGDMGMLPFGDKQIYFGQTPLGEYILGASSSLVAGYLRQISGKKQGYKLPPVSIVNPHQQLFQIIDDMGGPEKSDGGAGGAIAEDKRGVEHIFARRLADQYILSKIWIDFLRGGLGQIENSEGMNQKELKEDNDRIAKLLAEGATKVYPEGITIEKHKTLHGASDPKTVHVSAVSDPTVPLFHDANVMVSYLDDEEAKDVIGDLDSQKKMIPQTTWVNGVEYSIFSSFGKRPSVVLRRDGVITGTVTHPESLKLMAGKGPAYELLRRDVLFICSQLSCSRHVLQEMWGDMFKPAQKTPRVGAQRAESLSNGQKDPLGTTDVDRSYPSGSSRETGADDDVQDLLQALMDDDGGEEGFSEEGGVNTGDIEERVDDTLESVKRASREHTVNGYRKIQPLIQRRDGSFVAPKPSKKAIAKALLPLRQGVQIPKFGRIYKPNNPSALQKLLSNAGVETPEEFVERFPEQAYVVYETWVSSFVRGNPEMGRIETVKGHIVEGVSSVVEESE